MSEIKGHVETPSPAATASVESTSPTVTQSMQGGAEAAPAGNAPVAETPAETPAPTEAAAPVRSGSVGMRSMQGVSESPPPPEATAKAPANAEVPTQPSKVVAAPAESPAPSAEATRVAKEEAGAQGKNGDRPSSDTEKQTSTLNENKKADPAETESDETLNCTYNERFNHTPKNDGSWIGERGESKWTPDDPDVKNTLAKYGVDGINYKNCFPDFQPVTEYTAQLSDEFLLKGDKEQFLECNRQLLEASQKDPAILEKFSNIDKKRLEKLENPVDYTWHHDVSTGIMRLVPSDVHQSCLHLGGRRIWGGGNANR